jgi:hypothetical protein
VFGLKFSEISNPLTKYTERGATGFCGTPSRTKDHVTVKDHHAPRIKLFSGPNLGFHFKARVVGGNESDYAKPVATVMCFQHYHLSSFVFTSSCPWHYGHTDDETHVNWVTTDNFRFV